MIISKTPFRISLFGGGTDYPAWYQEHGGGVIGMGINKYAYISVNRLRPFFDSKYRIIWSMVEDVNKIEEIQHPCVRVALDWMHFENEGLEISYRGDLPARSGLGTSSSFVVGLLKALFALRQRRPLRKHELATTAIHFEREVLKESVGSQDQVWASYGGFNHIDFEPGGKFKVMSLEQDLSMELEESLMLFFTGFTRTASEIAKKQIENIPHRFIELSEIANIRDEAHRVIRQKDGADQVVGISKLLNESWKLKKRLADGVSNDELDQIYETGLKYGALGGKLLGAGGGGFMLFIVPPERQQSVIKQLLPLIYVPFRLDESGGSYLIVDEEDF